MRCELLLIGDSACGAETQSSRDRKRLDNTTDIQEVLHVRARIAPPVKYVDVKGRLRTRGARNFEIESGIEGSRVEIVIEADGGVGGLSAGLQTVAAWIQQFNDTVQWIRPDRAMSESFQVNQTAAVGNKLIKVRVGIWRGRVDGINVGTDGKRNRDWLIRAVAEGRCGSNGVIAAQTRPNLNEIIRS